MTNDTGRKPEGAPERVRSTTAPRGGYLPLPVVEQHLAAADCDAFRRRSARRRDWERCREADLIACARHQQGRIRIQQGQGARRGSRFWTKRWSPLLSPLVTGLTQPI